MSNGVQYLALVVWLCVASLVIDDKAAPRMVRGALFGSLIVFTLCGAEKRKR